MKKKKKNLDYSEHQEFTGSKKHDYRKKNNNNNIKRIHPQII